MLFTQVSRFNYICKNDTILVQFYTKTERKSMKCHDFSNLNLNDLKIAFQVNGKL